MKKIIVSVSSLVSMLSAKAALAVGWSTTNYSSTGLPSGKIESIISNIALWLLGMFGFFGVIGFVISGIYYLTAAGSAEQEKTAKKAMQMSIIGIIVGLMGLVIIKAVDSLLRPGGGGGFNLFF